jgi:hypothetical protein
MLRWREGGWVFVLAVALMAAIMAWRLPGMLASEGAVGDGKDPASYGFDLSRLTVDGEQLTASGMPRDGLRALEDPPPATVAEIDALSWGGHGHGHFLVPDDRVIGVVAGGQARAYPLSILNWHEVANDTLGGVPIVVTYNPLAEAAAVFDRRVDGAPRSFGFSGLLLASSLVMYDGGGETSSLWAPLIGAGIGGPAAGEPLATVEYALVRWGDWLDRHPDTTVMAPDLDLKRVYKRKPYESYRGSQRLRFSVDPLPDDPELALKDPVVAVEIAGSRQVFPVARIYERAGDGGSWRASLGGQSVEFQTGTSPTVFVTADGGTSRVWYASWFAWYALHPDDPVLPAVEAQ